MISTPPLSYCSSDPKRVTYLVIGTPLPGGRTPPPRCYSSRPRSAPGRSTTPALGRIGGLGTRRGWSQDGDRPHHHGGELRDHVMHVGGVGHDAAQIRDTGMRELDHPILALLQGADERRPRRTADRAEPRRGAGAGLGLGRGPSDRDGQLHTSELQSHHELVCRLLLEKKKNK